MRLSKKWLCHFFEKESLRSAPADAKLCEAFFDKLFCSSGK